MLAETCLGLWRAQIEAAAPDLRRRMYQWFQEVCRTSDDLCQELSWEAQQELFHAPEFLRSNIAQLDRMIREEQARPDRGYSRLPQLVIQKLERMEELGLIDDRRFGEDYAKELFSRTGYGARRAAQELRRNGLDQELVQELVEKYGSPEQSGENIRRVLEKKYPGWREDEKARRRAFAALQRLGYSYQEVREAMGQGEDWE